MLRWLTASEWELPAPEGAGQIIPVGFIAATSKNQVPGKNMLTGSISLGQFSYDENVVVLLRGFKSLRQKML